MHKTGWFVGLILLQALILDNVHITGVVIPFLHVHFILKLNSDTSRNELILQGFCIGLAIDIFFNTLGMNVVTTMLLAFLRPLFLRLSTPHDTLDSIVPSLKSVGVASFLKYLVVSVFVHHLMLLALKLFSLINVLLLLLRVVSNTVLTITCIMAAEGVGR